MTVRECLHCGSSIPKIRPTSNYCSDKCRGDRWRKDNKWDHSAYVVRKRLRRRQRLDKYKTAKGCSSCGYNTHPEALHFDHIDPKGKRNIVSGMYGYSLKVLFKEIRKCRVLCANCHAVHSAKQMRKEL